MKYIRACLLLSSVLALSSVRDNVHGLCKTSITKCAAVEHDAYLLSVLQALGYSAVSGNDNLLQLREKKGEGRGGGGGGERRGGGGEGEGEGDEKGYNHQLHAQAHSQTHDRL